MSAPNYVASNNIYPSRFVTLSGEFAVAQSAAGDEPIGISSEAPFYPQLPFPGSSSEPYAGVPGQPVQVYGLAEYCLLQSNPEGSGWSYGDLLMPDANGYGQVVASTANSASGARAETNNNPGEFTRVLIVFHPGD